MKRTQIYLKESQFKKLKAYSNNKSISLAESVREMVDIGFETKLEGHIAKHSNERVGDLLLESRKKLSFKGPKDLSNNTDKYVYGI